MNFEELGKLLEDHQTGMSDFQDDYLVTVRAGGTVYGQYKQALREVYKRFRGLRELVYGDRGRKILDLELEELQEEFDEMEEGREKDKLEIKIKHRIMLREESDRAIKDTYREFARFYQQASALKEQIGDLTPQKRRELEFDMWKFKAKEMAVFDMLQSGRVGQKPVEFISVLPKSIRDELFRDINNRPNEIMDEYMNREEVHTLDFESMELPKLDISSVEGLIEEHSASE